MDQGTKFSQQNISEASRMFWEEVWLERAVLFGFGHLLCFVVGSKKSRQVRKRGRKKNASETPWPGFLAGIGDMG